MTRKMRYRSAVDMYRRIDLHRIVSAGGQMGFWIVGLSTLVLITSPGTAQACDPGTLKFPITNKEKTFIRKGNGEWKAPRANDKPHGGVDLIVNASYSDNASYTVYPIASGTVAYSQLNGTQTKGYGNTIVIDHGNNCYSLYAHLASSPFTPLASGGNLLKQVGDTVQPQIPIGYFVNIEADVDSTGNARSTAPEARHQVHFELISAQSGRRGSGALGSVILKDDGHRVDPTPVLKDMGYQIR